ncbi:MAG: 4-hydroxythreonine-4-phosphate dehydrogenase PdxA [Armatimonadetes bacterium]|nr:4-hydroxythreonine-4-phosphate dehydrogenase PdxA [Armatimonadota bacterium]
MLHSLGGGWTTTAPFFSAVAGRTEVKPVLAITPGDPAGIGPEIVARVLCDAEVFTLCRPLVIGPAAALAEGARAAGVSLRVAAAATPDDAGGSPGEARVLEPEAADLTGVRAGRVSPEAGRAAAESALLAARLALEGRVDALVTAPLNKEAMRLAGYPFAGHTELLGDACGVAHPGMMLVSGNLRVAHVSTHVSLAEAVRRVTRERVGHAIRLAGSGLRLLGLGNGRIAVSGLNPHAGENGLFGDEEARAIVPAVAEARAGGLDVEGPIAPDTVFMRGLRGEFAAVVAMYHDQGHIPVKLLGMERGVNVTLGLPILRTSVDHGTAFDIAGRGVASPESLRETIRLAARMARRRATGDAG